MAQPPAPPPPPAPPAAPPAVLAGMPALLELDRAAAQEKTALVSRVKELPKDAKAKWWTFCKAHGESMPDAHRYDMPFLVTFFEALDTMIIDPSCPFAAEAEGEAEEKERKIFVGGLPRGTKEDALWHFFGQWGKVAKVDCKKDDEGLPKGFAFVTFADKAHAKQVVENRDNNMIDGKWIDCKAADAPKGEKGVGKDKGKGGKDNGGKDGAKGGKGGDDPACRLFVGGLPKTATQESIKAFFSYYGQVTDVQLKYDPQGVSRGFCFINFSGPEAVTKALAHPSIEFEGKWVECKSASKTDDKGAGKGDKDKGGKDKGGKDKDKGGSGVEWSSNNWQSSDSGNRGDASKEAWSSGKGGWSDSNQSGGSADQWGSGGGGGGGGADGGYGAAQKGGTSGAWGPY